MLLAVTARRGPMSEARARTPLLEAPTGLEPLAASNAGAIAGNPRLGREPSTVRQAMRQ